MKRLTITILFFLFSYKLIFATIIIQAKMDQQRCGYKTVTTTSEKREFINGEWVSTFFIDCSGEGERACYVKCSSTLDPINQRILDETNLSQPVVDAILFQIQENINNGLASGTIVNGNVTFYFQSNSTDYSITINGSN